MTKSSCSLRAQIRRVREYVRENPSPENKAKLAHLQLELREETAVTELFRIFCGFSAKR